MNQSLYPLQFNPIFKEKIWGGQRIKNKLGFQLPGLNNCGELWSLSGYESEQSEVANGFLEGNSLNELVEIYMDDLVGSPVYEKFGDVFPILVKILDAEDWLSIQVHPDDELAQERGLLGGKTEMWYILDAEADSKLIAGFSQKVDKEIYMKAIADKKLPDIMNFEDVKVGDVFFMPSGRVHALGPGILLAEIQQTSDTTYRIYDWDRVDDKGKARELHLEEAMDAIDFQLYDNYKTPYNQSPNITSPIVDTKFFTTNLLHLTRNLEKNYVELDSFVILLCIEGQFSYKDELGNSGLIKAGESLLIPALLEKIELYPQGSCKILEVYILEKQEK